VLLVCCWCVASVLLAIALVVARVSDAVVGVLLVCCWCVAGVLLAIALVVARVSDAVVHSRVGKKKSKRTRKRKQQHVGLGFSLGFRA
jgi:membrane protein implicated in regulation of membrane protease activity